MSFDAKEFIDIAELLSNSDVKESRNRSIINRCYYGAFGHLKTVVPGFVSHGGSSVHLDLIAYLKRSTILEEIKVGKELELLFAKRKEADYSYNNSSTNFSQLNVSFYIKSSKNIVKYLS